VRTFECSKGRRLCVRDKEEETKATNLVSFADSKKTGERYGIVDWWLLNARKKLGVKIYVWRRKNREKRKRVCATVKLSFCFKVWMLS